MSRDNFSREAVIEAHRVLYKFPATQGEVDMFFDETHRVSPDCKTCVKVEEYLNKQLPQSRETVYSQLVQGEPEQSHLVPWDVIDLMSDRALGLEPASLLAGQKKDNGKLPLHLVPWDVIDLLSDACTKELNVDSLLELLTNWWTGRTSLVGATLSSEQVRGITAVLAMGAQKYSPRGWEKGIEYSRVFSAAIRHLLAIYDGEETDTESGLPHLHHALCNYLFLIRFEQTNRVDLDDRPRIISL